MNRAIEVSSYAVTIFVAGDVQAAETICRAYCRDVGLCVTVTPTNFIYTGGSQTGVAVGLINYPRFPKQPVEVWNLAEALAARLVDELFQDSCTVQAPDRTIWLSRA